VYEELEEVAERRRLLETCLARVVIHRESILLHLPAHPGIVRYLSDRPDAD
jgi:hypothetical protein